MRCDVSLLSADDLFIFNEGNHFRLYESWGAIAWSPTKDVYFAVWLRMQEFMLSVILIDWHEPPLGPREIRYLGRIYSRRPKGS